MLETQGEQSVTQGHWPQAHMALCLVCKIFVFDLAALFKTVSEGNKTLVLKVHWDCIRPEIILNWENNLFLL